MSYNDNIIILIYVLAELLWILLKYDIFLQNGQLNQFRW